MKHYKIKIYGKVQGVYFRESTVKKALELGVKGFVRNEDDGSVYCEAEATKEIIDKFIKWCKSGVELSRVDDVKIIEGKILGFGDFSGKN